MKPLLICTVRIDVGRREEYFGDALSKAPGLASHTSTVAPYSTELHLEILRSVMDRLQWAADHLGLSSLTWAQCATTAAALLVLYAAIHYASGDEHRVPSYAVEPPAQCKPGWTGEELDEPQLKA